MRPAACHHSNAQKVRGKTFTENQMASAWTTLDGVLAEGTEGEGGGPGAAERET